jgi:hypothetical protein
LLPHFEGQLLAIHENAQEKKVKKRVDIARLISDFFSQEKTINALQTIQMLKRLQENCHVLLRFRLEFFEFF